MLKHLKPAWRLSIPLILTLGVMWWLSGCVAEEKPPWIPVLEETGFSYLEGTAKRIAESLDKARQDLAAEDGHDAQDSLRRAAQAAGVLLFYDIPVTDARQLIYDAGRLYTLGRPRQARLKIDQADRLLQRMGKSNGAILAAHVNEALLLTKELRLAMEANSAVAERFEALGHKINMMAMKADLILSGADFSGPHHLPSRP